MPMMMLSDAEAKSIVDARLKADRIRMIVHGIGLAADHLDSLGRECSGGDGETINPRTGNPYGETYFRDAQHLRHFAGKVAAGLRQVL